MDSLVDLSNPLKFIASDNRKVKVITAENRVHLASLW